MNPQLRRPLAMIGVVTFGVLTGALAALGHSPIAIGFIGAVVAFGVLIGLGARAQGRQTARSIDELAELTRRIERGVRRTNEKAAERDQRLRDRDRHVVERVEELERRLLAGLDAERQRAADRHREAVSLLERDGR